MKILDLCLFHAPGSQILTGRSKGVVLRGALHIDELDAEAAEFQVAVCAEITALHADFFTAVFGASLRKLGREAFLAKYQFKCSEVVRADVDRAIESVLVENSEPVAA